jgi:hypothetical protein
MLIEYWLEGKGLKNMTNTFLKILIVLFCISNIAACSKKNKWVVLYKGSVMEGNSIVWFASKNDEDGNWAEGHCNELAKVYAEKFNDVYICSTAVFDTFKPNME